MSLHPDHVEITQSAPVEPPDRRGAHEVMGRGLPIINTRRLHIPQFVRPYLVEGWLVGGGARYLTGQQDVTPRDWDVLVPAHRWSEVLHLIPGTARVTPMGGIKIADDSRLWTITADVWPGDIDVYLARVTKNVLTQTAIRLPLELVVVRAAQGCIGTSDGQP